MIYEYTPYHHPVDDIERKTWTGSWEVVAVPGASPLDLLSIVVSTATPASRLLSRLQNDWLALLEGFETFAQRAANSRDRLVDEG
jgi:hypothetical protein